MTAKKANPAKRGRKAVSNDIRRGVVLRWICFLRDRQRADSSVTGADVAGEFIQANQSWFRAHGISPGDYRSLKNILVDGRKDRNRQAIERRRDWGIITNLAGKKILVSNAAYIRACQRGALGIGPQMFLFGPELK